MVVVVPICVGITRIILGGPGDNRDFNTPDICQIGGYASGAVIVDKIQAFNILHHRLI